MTTSSQSLFRRLTPYFSAPLRQNYRLLSSASASSSALYEPQPSSSSSSESPSLDVVHLTENCVRRMKELQASKVNGKLLRLSIDAGGCSGFQYNFLLDHKTNDDDRIFERDGVKLVVDNISYDFVKGSTIDYVEEMIRSAFQVSANPSAVGGCSCKSSFMTTSSSNPIEGLGEVGVTCLGASSMALLRSVESWQQKQQMMHQMDILSLQQQVAALFAALTGKSDNFAEVGTTAADTSTSTNSSYLCPLNIIKQHIPCKMQM
ncbi:unnamed protein product [Fraxinus pennsylvanica]|uniref:Core domain-containing protein n=1 Tax=Fraxinus pennsylvanica TaxID=56036 RepID=A0AAD2DT64_9LAMI|nr:unnamed protein product [Fraxinus pennsylvanica]